MPCEFTALAAAIEAGNDPLPPYIGKLIQCAPDSFEDPRAGEVAITIRTMRGAGEIVGTETVCAKCPELELFILSNLPDSWLPISAAESYALDYWDKYQRRRAASIGDELIRALNSSPGQSKRIIATARAALDAIDGDSNTLAEKLEARLYSPTARPTEPTPRFYIAGTGICTPDNLTTISAPAKAGKSAAKGAMIASTFAAAGADCLGFKSENPLGFAVVDLDTEQAPFDHWHVIEQARLRAQCASVPRWVQSYRLAGLNAGEVREAIRLTIELAAKQFGGIHSVFVDGVADAVNDVNDPAEAGDLVAELHELAIKFNCAILLIIHINPGSQTGKTRGHLGSQLERKSETNLRLDKDENGVTVIWADKNRRAPITKTTAPRFVWCDQAGMHTSIQSAKSSQQDADREILTELAQEVFSQRSSMRRMELETTVMTVAKAKAKTAERKVTRMIELGIIKKSIAGLYTTTT